MGTSRNDNFMIFLCLKVLKKTLGMFELYLGLFESALKTLGLFELCQARCFGPLKKVILPRMVRSLLMINTVYVYVYLGIGQITF